MLASLVEKIDQKISYLHFTGEVMKLKKLVLKLHRMLMV